MRLLLPALLCALLFALPTRAAESVTLLYASHLADIQNAGKGGLPALATLLRELRDTRDQVVFIHGGNALGPSPLASFDKGTHMIGLLNLLEPTAMAVGRRDFMHREDELTLRSHEALFPMICSNVLDPLSGEQPEGLVRLEELTESGYSLGMAALVSPELETSYIQDRVKVLGGYELLPRLTASLREDGVDGVIACADFLPRDPQLALEQSGADILFITDAGANQVTLDKGKALVLQGDPGSVLLMELQPDEEGALHPVKAEFLPLDAYPADPEMSAAIQDYVSSLESLMSIPVGVSATPLDTRRLPLRTSENAFANLVTDAMRAYYEADVALLNSGGLRGDRQYDAGRTLTRGDLQTEMPLHDSSCLTTMKGSDLLAALEHGLSGIESARGRFLQVSGMNYAYAPDAPPGRRVRAATVQGLPLDPDAVYRVSAPRYLVAHGDGFTMFENGCLVTQEKPSLSLVELVRAYIAAHTPVAPQCEGRISTSQ